MFHGEKKNIGYRINNKDSIIAFIYSPFFSYVIEKTNV